MTEIPRLNGVIRALEQGQCALTSFASVDVEAALAFGSSQYDGVVFDVQLREQPAVGIEA